jgi:hypothetical protein
MKQWNPEIKMELEHRGVVILRAALPALIKTLKKGAREESQLLGAGVHDEAIKYCTWLYRECDIALEGVELAVPEGSDLWPTG